MMVSIKDIIRWDSSKIRLPKTFKSSSLWYIPLEIISANPLIDVKGVFNSWETFAENSRRMRSAM